LVGSEGTLGVITRLLLRVVPRRPPGAVVLVGLPDIERVVEVVAAVRRDVSELRAVETVGAAVRDLVALAHGRTSPVTAPWLLLCETVAAVGAFEELTAAVSRALDVAGVSDAPVAAAEDPAGMRALWAWRDGATDAVARAAADRGLGVTKLDVTLPTRQLAAFERDLELLMRGRAEQLFLFGHVGDGNLHVNLLGPLERSGSSVDTGEIEDLVLHLVAAHNGSISAEHGIGRAKAPWLPLARTLEERRAMRAIKVALDPDERLGRAIWISPERTDR
jgi:FAD/FMN-containing dehydrogenase